MKPTCVLAALAVAAAGCGSGFRGWHEEPLPTHDRQLAFGAAQDVLAREFPMGEANWIQGVIETRWVGFDGKGITLPAGLRRSGDGWRRRAVCEIDRDGLTVIARVAVPVQSATSVQAIEAARVGEGRPNGEASPALAHAYGEAGRSDHDVWTDAGYDDAMARDLLGKIVDRVKRMEQDQAMPQDQTPGEMMEESKRIGASQGY